MHKLQVLIIIDLRYFLLALKLIFSKIYRFSVINAKDLSKSPLRKVIFLSFTPKVPWRGLSKSADFQIFRLIAKGSKKSENQNKWFSEWTHILFLDGESERSIRIVGQQKRIFRDLQSEKTGKTEIIRAIPSFILQ